MEVAAQCKFNSCSLHMKAHGPKLYKEQKNSGVIAESDFKYMAQKPDGDASFNPDNNRKVVEAVIRKTKAREREIRKQYMENIEERVDASISFLKALASGKYESVDSNTAAMRYFGRRELARLRGEQIRSTLMGQMILDHRGAN